MIDGTGSLRIYLGAAPGVGKTFAMLNEGRRRHERGTDVVVGYVETHGRPRTAEQIGDLEVVPRRPVEYRGATFEEMDVDAILARKPAQVARRRARPHERPGLPQREALAGRRGAARDAGIDVISTLNIQHLESLNDVVERITGVKQRETIPDAVVRQADQIELVDMSPEALRRRMAHGNIYKPEKIDAALAQLLPARQPRGAARARAAVGRGPGRRSARASTASGTASPSRGRRANACSSRSPARREPRR